VRKHVIFVVAIAATALAVLAAVPGIASAHEKRQVGAYTFVVGFLNEPAVVDQPNSIDLTVTDTYNQPVTGAEKTLKAQIVSGGSTQDMSLTPRFNAPGKYNAVFIPTKSGTWKFHFTGNVNGQTVDETFTSGPNTFSDVNATDTLAFPVKTGDRTTANEQTAAAKSTADSAQSSANTGMVLGIVGIIVGALGLAVGGIALRQARRMKEDAARGGASVPRTA
jgi:hypothetical protein